MERDQFSCLRCSYYTKVQSFYPTGYILRVRCSNTLHGELEAEGIGNRWLFQVSKEEKADADNQSGRESKQHQSIRWEKCS